MKSLLSFIILWTGGWVLGALLAGYARELTITPISILLNVLIGASFGFLAWNVLRVLEK